MSLQSPTVVINTPHHTSWVCPHPNFFHRNSKWPMAWTKIILLLEKVWVTPHPWHVAHKVSSPTVWVSSHPWPMAHRVPSLKSGCANTNDVWSGTVQLCYLLVYLYTTTCHFGVKCVMIHRWQRHEVSWRRCDNWASHKHVHKKVWVISHPHGLSVVCCLLTLCASHIYFSVIS